MGRTKKTKGGESCNLVKNWIPPLHSNNVQHHIPPTLLYNNHGLYYVIPRVMKSNSCIALGQCHLYSFVHDHATAICHPISKSFIPPIKRPLQHPHLHFRHAWILIKLHYRICYFWQIRSMSTVLGPLLPPSLFLELPSFCTTICYT